MPSALVLRIAPYFVIGWLLGVTLATGPVLRDIHGGTTQPRSAEFYEPPLHPATVALGQALFSVLGLAIFARRNEKLPVRVEAGNARI